MKYKRSRSAKVGSGEDAFLEPAYKRYLVILYVFIGILLGVGGWAYIRYGVSSEGKPIDISIPSGSASSGASFGGASSGSEDGFPEHLEFPALKDNETLLKTWTHESESLKIEIEQRRYEDRDITYFVCDVRMKSFENIKNCFAKDKFGTNFIETISSIGARNNAVLAVNADYCGIRNTGIIIRDGLLYRDKPNNEMTVFYKDGTMKSYHEKNVDAERLVIDGAWQSYSFGPVLVEDGNIRTEFDSNVIRANPRTAVGWVAPNHYRVIIVDGRNPGYSVGMSLYELADEFARWGCFEAYNLDGGGSTTLYFKGEVLNRPSYGDERRSSEALCFID